MGSVSPIIGIEKGIAALQEWLWDQHYSQHCVERIAAHVAAAGTLAGCDELDPEDEAAASEVYCEALPRVPGPSWHWDYGDMAGEWIDDEAIATRPGFWAYEPDDDGSLTPTASDGSEPVRPLCGGAPEPYAPSPEDLAEAAAYAAWVDAMEEQRRAAEPPVYGYE